MANQPTRKEIEAKIIAHAWKDENFRKELLKDPKAALKKHGLNIPNDVQWKIIEEDETNRYTVLPKAPLAAKSLSEHELEKLAAASCGTATSYDMEGAKMC